MDKLSVKNSKIRNFTKKNCHVTVELLRVDRWSDWHDEYRSLFDSIYVFAQRKGE
jgi:hypothetical protein